MSEEQEGAYLLCQKVDVIEPENTETIQIQNIQELSTIDSKINKEESNFIKIMILVIGIISILFGGGSYSRITTYTGIITYVLLPVIFGIICILFSVTNVI